MDNHKPSDDVKVAENKAVFRTYKEAYVVSTSHKNTPLFKRSQ
jgi:hypothetical protein